MSKLRELVNRGVRLIVSDDAEQPNLSPPPPPEEAAPSQPDPVALESLDAPVPRPSTRSEVPLEAADFAAVYGEAGIELPGHGYGVEKVGSMLASKRLAPLSREVRAAAVLAALEAAGAPIRDVVQDAVRRDKALDAYEAAKQREVAELQQQASARIDAIKAEIDEFLRAKNAEIEDLKKMTEGASRAFEEMRSRKRSEEERLFDVVAHFVEPTDNPVTTPGHPGPLAKGPVEA